MADTLCDMDLRLYCARFGMRRATGMCIRWYNRIPGGEMGGWIGRAGLKPAPTVWPGVSRRGVAEADDLNAVLLRHRP